MKIKQISAAKLLRIILIGSLVTLLMAWNINCFGQDTIYQRKGEAILSNVTEVNESAVKYKRFDNAEGPLYILRRDLITFIRYKNGAVDSFPEIKPWFRPASEEPVQSTSSLLISNPSAIKKKRYEISVLGSRFLLNGNAAGRNEILDIIKEENDPELNKYVRKAKTAGAFRPVCFLGIPLAFAGLVIAAEGGQGTGLGTDAGSVGVSMMLAGGGCIGGAIALKNIQKKSTARAVKMYNVKY